MPDPVKPDDKNKNDQIDLSKNPQFVQLMGVVTQLGKGQQTLTERVGGLSKSVVDLVKGIQNPPTKKEEKKTPTEEEINEMSQVQLTQHIFGGMRQMLDGFKTDFQTALSKVSETAESGKIETQVEKLRSNHKDFDDWLPEIRDKIQATGGSISIGEAYTLVKASNPDKAKQLDEKYLIVKPENKKRESSFGGLTPTSRAKSGANESDDDDKTLTRSEAQEKAWDEIFGENPALAGEDAED